MELPLDNSFLELNKNAAEMSPAKESVKVALLFDSASQFFHKALKKNGLTTSLSYDIYESNYSQIENEIFIPSSKLYAFQPDVVVISYSTEKLYKKFSGLDIPERESFSYHMMKHFSGLVETLAQHSKSNIVFFNFPEAAPQVFGNYSSKVPSSFLFQIRKLNYELMNFAVKKNNFFILDINYLQNLSGQDFMSDPKLFIGADVVYSLNSLPLIAQNLTGIILSLRGKSKKCLIMDLDNTIWGGVIGDDGIEKIQVGELGIGKAYSNLQLWIKQLKERGIILAVCSKNNEDIAKEPFISHPEMILKLEDIALFVANWNNKLDNIAYIQKTLNIGFDSLVFLDDNPFEREMIKSGFPDIYVPNLPEDPACYVTYLNKLNIFEATSFTGEDRTKTLQYQQEANRNILRENVAGEEDFLKSLNMEAEIENINKFNFPRILQLFGKTNQFNLRTIRYPAPEFERISNLPEYKVLSVKLKDKFGDYGIVSAVVLKKETDTFFIDNWVMSCRVFNRGLEHYIFNYLLELCRLNAVHKISGEYLPTNKNKVIENLFSDLGFLPEDGSKWSLSVESAVPVINYIK